MSVIFSEHKKSSSLTGWEGQSPACFGSTGMEGPRAAGSKTDQRHRTVQICFARRLAGSPGMVLVKGSVSQGEVVSLLHMPLKSRYPSLHGKQLVDQIQLRLQQSPHLRGTGGFLQGLLRPNHYRRISLPALPRGTLVCAKLGGVSRSSASPWGNPERAQLGCWD